MTQVPASSHGWNGGTITSPLTVDLSDDPANQRALHVILPETFDFSVEAFTFEVENQFGLLGFTTSGAVSAKGNTLQSGGGSIRTNNGSLLTGTGSLNNQGGITSADPVSGDKVIEILPAAAQIGFFNKTPAARPAAIANAAGGVVIDAEARTALNALLAAIRTLGLIAT